MFSRFITWQEPPVPYAITDGSKNYFTVGGDSIDIRFSLAGYGYRKFDEQQRAFYHFGTYRCYLRKVGDTDYQLFANAVCERAESDSGRLYKDIAVQTGILEKGEYEIFIEAGRIWEFKYWNNLGDGAPLNGVEGTDTEEQFWYGLQARQQTPNNVRAYDYIDVEDISIQGCNPLKVNVIDSDPVFFDGMQIKDILLAIALEHNIYGIFEPIAVSDVLTIKYDYDVALIESIIFLSEFNYVYLNVLNTFRNELVAVSEVFQANIPGYNTVSDFISVQEFAFTNVVGVIYVSDSVNVSEFAQGNKPRFREVDDAIHIAENVLADIASTIPHSAENISVTDETGTLVHIEYDTYPQPFDTVGIFEDVVALVAFTAIASDSVLVSESSDVNIFGQTKRIEDISVTEFISVAMGFAISVNDIVTVAEVYSVTIPVIVVSETITVSENAKIALLSPSVIETIIVIENAQAKTAWLVVANENISISEVAFRNVFISLSVSDTVSVAEFREVSSLTLSVFDALFVSEFRAVIPQPLVNVFDFAGFIIENVLLDEPNLFIPPYAEFINVNEVVTASCPNTLKRDDILVIDVFGGYLDVLFAGGNFETITISELVYPSLSQLYFSAFDNVTASETVIIGGVKIFDSVTVSEFASIGVSVNIPVKVDLIGITEFAMARVGLAESTATDDAGVNGALFDSISIDEFVSYQIVFDISLSRVQTVTVVDYTNVEIGLAVATPVDNAGVNGALVDSISITEFAVAVKVNIVNVSVFSAVTVAEFRSAQPTLASSVSDSVGVNDGLFDIISIQEFLTIGVI